MTPEREAVAKIVMEWNETPGHREMSLVDRIITEHLTPLRIALATAEREAKNAKALAVARGNVVKKCRDMFINIKDELEDEGDRIYFGSTNHADDFKQCVDELDSWNWEAIIDEGKIPDVYEISRKAHEQLRAAESRAASLEGLLTEASAILLKREGSMCCADCIEARLETTRLLTRIEAREGGEEGASAGEEKGRG